ncbi:MAG: formylmethanofuran--tetrahydromethanopterin N-formyltransferase [Phycisphaeraceae bacterium]|nr:formylmethanofuran--tetrahydromethanopterin N-formyltransferase [Phycisphaeraceae bacterium]
MKLYAATIEDTFAEAFRMWAARVLVTATSERWVKTAIHEACGYGTSVIGCDAEAGCEHMVTDADTPDGRPGAWLLMFAFKPDPLGEAMIGRVGQALMTCPTTAVYDGLPDVDEDNDDQRRLPLGDKLRYFGDGFQKSKVLDGRRYWRIPVMDGEFVVEESVGAVKAIAGGNFLVGGPDVATALTAAEAAVEAIAPLPEVITPFPGGIVRSGSKVGSQYDALFASTNDAHCPTLRSATESHLPDDVQAVYEIVINGLSESAIRVAMRRGIDAAAKAGATSISAGNYGGDLGKFHFPLHEIMETA